MPKQSTMLHVVFANSQQAVSFLVMTESLQENFGKQMGLDSFVLKFSNNNGITQAAFPLSGSSSTWGTNGFTFLSKDGVEKEDHLNIQPHGQAGNRTRDLLASSQRSYQLS